MKKFLQQQISKLAIRAIALSVLFSAYAAFAEVPLVGFNLQKEGHEVSGQIAALEGITDIQEFIAGFSADIKKERAKNPKVQVAIQWVDVVEKSADRGLAAIDDNVEEMANAIALRNERVEVHGHHIQLPHLLESTEGLTPSQQRYVRNTNLTAFVIKVGVVGGVECVLLFLTHHAPMWVPVLSGILTCTWMIYNYFHTDEINNLINHMKFKSLSDPEAKALEAEFEAMSPSQRIVRLPVKFIMSFLYEVVWQGTLQAAIATLDWIAGNGFNVDAVESGTSILWGTGGELPFDRGQDAYQLTRAGHVPLPVRKANMRMIGAISSLMGVPGVLARSSHNIYGTWSLGTMIITGSAFYVYMRYTDQIHNMVLPVISGAGARMRDFMRGVSKFLDKAQAATCNALATVQDKYPW